MALETLKDIDKIGGFDVIRKVPEGMSWEEFDEYRKEAPIFITDHLNMISFKIQDGPIKESGVTGCQVDTMIEAAKLIIEKLNQKYWCAENDIVISHLRFALHWLAERKVNREKRGVEGRNER